MMFRMPPFPGICFPDLITGYSPSPDFDAQKSPLLNEHGPVLFTDLPCAVNDVTSTSEGVHEVDAESGYGVVAFEICTATDPGITQKGQFIDWTKNNKGVFATPIHLISSGATRPAKGIGSVYRTSVKRRD